jgi:membrane carboxypeptidase/penicillin-binding protein
VSNDFIEINDNSGQNVVPFYVERIERGRDLTTRETEKENVCERERERESLAEKGIAWAQRSGHSHKQLMEM